MNNKIPKELAERQEQQRQNTVNTVRKAIEDLSAEGHKITIKLLMEYTGLSRSVFGKNHVKTVLSECSINKQKECAQKQELNDKDKLKAIINEQKMIIAQLKYKNKELEEECELLRGLVFIAKSKGYNHM